MNTSFYTEQEIADLGFKKVGKKVLISKKASFYGAEYIAMGNNVRIDDFCILSGNITLGNNIHIGAYCGLFGDAGIELMDYSGMSSKSIIYSAIDDFSGQAMIGPCVEEDKRKLKKGKVILEKYTQLGAASIVFPQVTMKEGSVTGAMTLVLKSLEEWGIYVGVPAIRIKERKRDLLKYF